MNSAVSVRETKADQHVCVLIRDKVTKFGPLHPEGEPEHDHGRVVGRHGVAQRRAVDDVPAARVLVVSHERAEVDARLEGEPQVQLLQAGVGEKGAVNVTASQSKW